MFQEQSFIHHGWPFTIEANCWPNEEAAWAAIIDLQSWTLRLGPDETASLHKALRQETEALVHDADYDRASPPLASARDAQRRAIRTGLQGHDAEGRQPTIMIDANPI